METAVLEPMPETHTKLAPKPTQRRYRRFTEADIDVMALLLTKRHTETEACEKMGINVTSWRVFKCKAKNDARFTNALARASQAKIEAHWNNIENHSVKDWRASKCILDMIDPTRFSGQQQAVAPTVNIYAQIGVSLDSIGSKVYAIKPKQAIVAQEQTKLLPAQEQP